MKQAQSSDPQRKYVLHFDVNKTILLSDAKYPEQTKEECLQEILVGYAWGKLDQKDEKSPIVWKLTHQTFTPLCPGEGMFSYKEYINQQFPLKYVTEESNAERLQEYNSSMIAQRKEQYHQFLKQGSPCIKLKPEYDRLVKTITLPKAVQEELRLKVDEQIDIQTPQEIQKKNLSTLQQEKDCLADLFSDGKYNLIPTFFKTIINLKKQKKEFAVVFRPFGTDPKPILREFNKFCIGDHPAYSGRNNTPIVKFDGSKGTKNYIIQERQCGLFYRFDKDYEVTQLAMGTLRRGDRKKILEDEYEKEIEEETVYLQKTPQGIYVQIMEQLKESCGLCLQDDYQFHESQGESMNEESAKLLFMDPTEYDTLHIFFDDNIHENDQTNLVQVVDVVSGEKISKKKSLNKYLVKVDILDAIKDQDYFIKIIDQCDKLRAEEIDRIEKGIPDDMPEVSKKSEFEQLLESTDSEYLRKTILPLLLPALTLVDIERPIDPVSFIAMYCLKNKEKVKIPQPTQEYLDAINNPDQDQEGQLQQTEIKK